MKNQQAIKTELQSRFTQYVQRGYINDISFNKARLLNSLMKSWYTADGKLWTLRTYLLKYDRKEYKSILNAISVYYKSGNIDGLKGINLDLHHFDQLKLNGLSFDGRLPQKFN